MKISTKCLLAIGAAACAALLVSTQVLADYAYDIEKNVAPNTTGITYDGVGDGVGNQAIITAIMSQPTTVGGRSYSTWAVLAQDGSGSMDIFSPLTTAGLQYTTPTVGDAITVTGKWSPFDAIPELNGITAISKTGTGSWPIPVNTISPPSGVLANPNDTPNAGPLAAGGLAVGNGVGDSMVEGYYCEIQNVYLNPWFGGGLYFPSNNATYYLTDQQNETLTMYFWYTSYSVCGAMSGNLVPSGTVDVYGMMSAYPATSKSGTIITTNWEDQLVPALIVQVPEPSSFMLAGAGLLSLLAVIRRRRS